MYKKVHDLLYRWYQKNGRHDLPWRQTNDAYAIWISEIMLQQTQVKTVLERFYFPFLEAFPTLADLAAANLDDVLKKWEGLGYYTRAKNLHRTARICAQTLPKNIIDLNTLPGIGKSTAHAIAAFAYKIPVPILDANVKRVLYRYFALPYATDKELWSYADKLFDPEHPFEYNQAMMDLGALICQAKAPQCVQCPLSLTCKGSRDNPLAYLKPKIKKKVPVRKRTIVVYKQNERYGMQQRQGRFLHGLWGFVQYDTHPVLNAKHLGDIIQKYSHFHLHAKVVLAETHCDELEWFHYDEIINLALSGADNKVLALIPGPKINSLNATHS